MSKCVIRNLVDITHISPVVRTNVVSNVALTALSMERRDRPRCFDNGQCTNKHQVSGPTTSKKLRLNLQHSATGIPSNRHGLRVPS